LADDKNSQQSHKMTFKRTPGTASDGSYLFVTIPDDDDDLASLSVPTTEQLLQRRRAWRQRDMHRRFVRERSNRACYLSGSIIILTLILAGVLHPWHKQTKEQHHRFMRKSSGPGPEAKVHDMTLNEITEEIAPGFNEDSREEGEDRVQFLIDEENLLDPYQGPSQDAPSTDEIDPDYQMLRGVNLDIRNRKPEESGET